MAEPATKYAETTEATQLSGFITREEGPLFIIGPSRAPWGVAAGSPEVRAKRAVGCLVRPLAGDRVLYALLADGSAFVLSVLERRAEDAAELSVDCGDLAIRARTGSVDIAAQDAVNIVGAKSVSMMTAKLELTAQSASVAFDKLALLGRELLGDIARGRLIGRVLESVADTMVQRAHRASRVVTELDHLKAGVIDHSAEKAMHLHGQNTVMTADELAKVDGANIHLG